MKTKTYVALLIAVVLMALLLGACSPAAPAQSQTFGSEPAISESAVPIEVPTIAPEPAQPAAAGPCQAAEGQQVFHSDRDGVCFVVPAGFSLETSETGEPLVSGQPLDDSVEALRVLLGVETRKVRPDANLTWLAGQYLLQYERADQPVKIGRSTVTLGEVDAEVLDGVPGRLSSRVVLVIQNERLYTLTFTPANSPDLAADLDALYQSIVGSMTFFTPADEPAPSVQPDLFILEDFGRRVSLTIPPELAMWVEAVTVPAVEPSPERMFSDANPAHMRLRLLGYHGAQPFELPYPMFAPQIAVFPTEEFSTYGADQPTGYPAQLAALQDLLANGIQPGTCGQTSFDRTIDDVPYFLPFLPWLNSRQAFCAQPELIEFEGGRGVRYLTYYTQGPGPLMDHMLVYVFQGVSEDGKLYVSAFIPVSSGVLPLTPPADYPDCIDPAGLEGCKAIVAEQIGQLNSQAGEAFSPALGVLDELVRSIHVTES